MKMYWSVFLLSLLLLAGCGEEQFGAVRQATRTEANSIKSYEQHTCSSFTLIKPKVDILFVVDNSSSNIYITSDIKTAIKNTVDSVSSQFDYRVIGTGLLKAKGDSTPFNDYQVLTNSSDPLSTEAASRKIISSNELNFFTAVEQDPDEVEAGLRRTIEFINGNSGTGLFRQGAYHLIVIVSNGRDQEVEYSPYANGQTAQYENVFNDRLSSFNAIKSQLNSQQLRLFSASANRICKPQWYSSEKSYVAMAQQLYQLSGATDSPSSDFYNLCDNSASQIFTAVNSSIKQILIPHTYRYWPITFAENNEMVDVNEIEVIKVGSNSSKSTLTKTTQWIYEDKGTPTAVNTRELPTVGEPITGRHFVRFTDNNLITYPDCVIVKSKSRVEYLGYVVLQKAPQVQSIVLRINGVTIPQSATNGWTYIGNQPAMNIKMPHPQAGDELPAIMKSGFMIQLNGSANYYKSGDSVTVDYLPAAI